MPQLLELDLKKVPWKLPKKLENSLQGIVSKNMIKVALLNCTKELFKGGRKIIQEGTVFDIVCVI